MFPARQFYCGICGLVALIGVPRPQAAISEEAYVWQRAWTPSVASAVTEHGGSFAQLDILAAEVSLPGPTAYPHIDWSALRAVQRPIALVVRLQHAPEGSAPEIIRVAQRVLAAARASGVSPVELQIDFDCPSSRLPDYLTLITALRHTLHPPRLTITALPDWLGRPAFVAVAQAVDVFTLQVHSVDRPSLDRPILLCDPAKAAAWIAQANRLGRPFRVALPDYGYNVGFTPDGRYLGLDAEGGEAAWPAGTVVKRAMAEPAGIARLVRSLQAHPPAHLDALAWFRLPTPDDDLCWPWTTLSAVRRGQFPSASIALRLALSQDGASDLILTNTGDGAALPSRLPLHLTSRQLLVWDLSPGWRSEPDVSGHLWIQPDPAATLPPLQPGESRRIGWLRANPPSHVSFPN